MVEFCFLMELWGVDIVVELECSILFLDGLIKELGKVWSFNVDFVDKLERLRKFCKTEKGELEI